VIARASERYSTFPVSRVFALVVVVELAVENSLNLCSMKFSRLCSFDVKLGMQSKVQFDPVLQLQNGMFQTRENYSAVETAPASGFPVGFGLL